MNRSDVRQQWEHTDEAEQLYSGDIDWLAYDELPPSLRAQLHGLRAQVVVFSGKLATTTRQLGEARELLWKLRRYEALPDGGDVDLEDAGIALAGEFDDWYARNPDPGPGAAKLPTAPDNGSLQEPLKDARPPLPATGAPCGACGGNGKASNCTGCAGERNSHVAECGIWRPCYACKGTKLRPPPNGGV